jgi:hypothetical protein
MFRNHDPKQADNPGETKGGNCQPSVPELSETPESERVIEGSRRILLPPDPDGLVICRKIQIGSQRRDWRGGENISDENESEAELRNPDDPGRFNILIARA